VKEEEKCFTCRLEGPLCPACGTPVAQHTDQNQRFATCADTLNYRLKRAAAYWEEKRVNDLLQLMRDAEEAND
jgi:hypothetical protein